MQWIKITDQLPPKSEDEKDIEVELLFLKSGFSGWEIFSGRYYEQPEKTTTFKESGFGKNRIITETVPGKNYITPNCMFGEYCSEEEVELDDVSYWAIMPELPKE